MTVQQNVSTLKPSTLRIYGAGGLAVNLLSPYLAKQHNEEVAGYASIDAVCIDTSRSNLLPNINEQRFYHIKGLDGGGKLRSLNVTETLSETKPFLAEHPARDVNLVLFSGAGATGATAGPVIFKDLIEHDKPTIAVVVLTDNSQIEAENSRKTIATLANMAKKVGKPFVCHFIYAHNRADADKQVREFISDIALLFSNNHLELDSADLKHFINYTTVTSAPASLASIKCYVTNDVKTLSLRNVISVAELHPSTDVPTGILKAEYSAVGYPRHGIEGSFIFTISTEGIEDIVKALEERENEFKRLSEGRRVIDVNSSDAIEDDSGLIL